MTPRPSFAPLAALLFAARFLAGCGGGGDGGKNDMIATLEADVAMLQADLAAARQAQRDAEADRADAEAAQADAEAAQALAEQQRNEANTAAGAAEARALDAEQKRQTAETARDDAITARDAALMAQQTAEDARDAALADKKTAEDALDAANTQATADLAALRQQLATANTNLQMAQDNLDDANDDLQDANDALTQARTDLATRTRERDTALQERNQAREALARAQGELEGLRASLTQAQQDAAVAEQRRREAEQEAERARTEAEQQANVSLLAQPFIAPLGAATQRTTASVEWMRGDSLKVDPGGGDFAPGSAAPSIASFRSLSFARQTGTANAQIDETAYVYTNIESPGSKAFWKKYGLTEPIVSGNAGMANPSGTTRTREVDGSNVTTIGGNFDGAGGTFSCVGDATTCTVERDTNNRLVFTTVTSWTFTPGSPTNTVTLNQDEEFLYFGIWYSVPNVVTASPTAGFQVIHGGSQAFTGVNGLSGRYRFRGGAIGRYAITPQVGQKARIGTFTADASLTAEMGSTPTLGGTIDNFREDGNTLSGWRVTLGDNAGVPTSFAGGTVSSSDGASASIGGVAATGAWSATLYGSGNDPDNELSDTNVYPVARYPAADLAGVAGHFEAATANNTAAIAGAFAATP